MKNIELGIVSDINQDYYLINPVMRPEEIRLGDPVKCSIIISGKNKNISLWSYCPFGFEFINHDETKYQIGESYLFFLNIGKTSLNISGSVVFIRKGDSSEKIVGIRINYNHGEEQSSNENRRSRSRWNCPYHLLPTGTMPNPNKFNDFIYFRIIDMSSNGLKLATSLRNKLLAIGQVLECTLSVPMIGTLCATIKINRVATEQFQEKDYLILGTSFVKFDSVISSTLSEYLLTFGENCSVKSLNDAGFHGHLGNSKFDFSYSKTSKDYDDVLALRLDSYRSSGKLSSEVNVDFMRDEYDARSRILTVKLGGELLGSARAMFHEKGDKTSHERYLTYPSNFPQIVDCLEVSRVCVKPDFQGVGLARELSKHLALLTIKAGRKFIYLSAAGSLNDFWMDLGFKDTGIRYVHKQLGNLEHKLLINDVQKSILGRGISANSWLTSYQHLYQYCEEYGLIEPSLIDQVRLQGFKIVGQIL